VSQRSAASPDTDTIFTVGIEPGGATTLQLFFAIQDAKTGQIIKAKTATLTGKGSTYSNFHDICFHNGNAFIAANASIPSTRTPDGLLLRVNLETLEITWHKYVGTEGYYDQAFSLLVVKDKLYALGKTEINTHPSFILTQFDLNTMTIRKTWKLPVKDIVTSYDDIPSLFLYNDKIFFTVCGESYTVLIRFTPSTAKAEIYHITLTVSSYDKRPALYKNKVIGNLLYLGGHIGECQVNGYLYPFFCIIDLDAMTVKQSKYFNENTNYGMTAMHVDTEGTVYAGWEDTFMTYTSGGSTSYKKMNASSLKLTNPKLITKHKNKTFSLINNDSYYQEPKIMNTFLHIVDGDTVPSGALPDLPNITFSDKSVSQLDKSVRISLSGIKDLPTCAISTHDGAVLPNSINIITTLHYSRF
jgi:hypothetical protein